MKTGILRAYNKYEFLFLGLFLASIFIVRTAELSQVGETWDEYPKIRNGQLHIKAIANLDFSKETWHEHEKHPPIGKIILALPTYIQKTLNLNPFSDNIYHEGKRYFLARIVSLLFSSGTLFLTYLIAKKLFNKKVAILSLVFLSLFPHFVAHSFVASLEGIQAFFSVLLIYQLTRIKNLDNKTAITIGLFLGVLFLIKLSSFLFIVYLLIYLSLYKRNENKTKIIKFLIVTLSISTIIFIAFWPWLWANPVLRLFESIDSITRDARTEVFLGGYNYLSWYYFLFYFVITTPIIYLIILAAGTVWLFKDKLIRTNHIIFVLLCFLSIFLMSFSGFKQNGVRYLYSSFPLLAILTGYFASINMRYAKSVNYQIALLIIFILPVIFINLLISPYYLDYYNEFVGGPKNVYEKRTAQINWWGEGTKEAVLWINKNLPRNAGICINVIPHHVVPTFRDDIRVEKDCVYDKEYLMYNTMFKWQDRFNVESIHTKVYEVSVMDAPLVEIYKVTKD